MIFIYYYNTYIIKIYYSPTFITYIHHLVMAVPTHCQCPHAGCDRRFKLNKKGTSKCLATHVLKHCNFRPKQRSLSKRLSSKTTTSNTLRDTFGTLTGTGAGKQVLLAGGGNIMRRIGAFRKGMTRKITHYEVEAFIGSERYFGVLDSALRGRMERECILDPDKSPVFTSFRKFYSSARPNATVGESGSWYHEWKDNGPSSYRLKELGKRQKGAWMAQYNWHGKVAWNWPHLLHNRKISGLCIQYKHYTKVLDILDEFLRSSELSYVQRCDIESILVDAANSIVDLPRWASERHVYPTDVRARLLKASAIEYRYIPARYSGLYDWYNGTEKGNLDYYIESEGGSITRNPDGTGRRRGRCPIAVWGHQRQMNLHSHERKYFDECNLPFSKNGRFIGPHYNPTPEYVPKS